MAWWAALCEESVRKRPSQKKKRKEKKKKTTDKRKTGISTSTSQEVVLFFGLPSSAVVSQAIPHCGCYCHRERPSMAHTHKVLIKNKPKSASLRVGWTVLIALLVLASLTCICYAFRLVHKQQQQLQLQQQKQVPVQDSQKSAAAANLATPLPSSSIESPSQGSPYAYVTLISGIDEALTYRGFLLNAILMRKSLKEFGSTADFVVMLGFSSQGDHAFFEQDRQLLHAHGIITYELPRLLEPSIPLKFAEMALLKVTPYSFVQYRKVQFFDGDVLPTRNMDCFFSLDRNTFTVGVVSPLNSGWFLAIPSMQAFQFFREKAIWRLGRDWDTFKGWGIPMPAGISFRGGKPCKVWEFNGADMDQGLFAHYFVLHHGEGLIVDSDLRTAKIFHKQGLSETVDMDAALSCCNGQLPTSFFLHYTGRSKPWMSQRGAMGPNTRKWMRLLDELHLEINSSNIFDHNLGSRLGFFNAGFPKGGYPTAPRKEST